MKKTLLSFALILSLQQVYSQTGSPTYEFQGGYSVGGVKAHPDAPGPVPAGLDIAIVSTTLDTSQRFSSVAVGDLDDDGDLDFIAGTRVGKVIYFKNTGTPTVPNWVATPLATVDDIAIAPALIVNEVRPELVDIDGDGDLDLLITSRQAYTSTGFDKHTEDVIQFINTGTKTVPIFTYTQLIIGGFGLPNNLAEFSGVNFVDIDNDGDFDLVSQGSDSIAFAKNIGTKFAPNFLRKYDADNPFDVSVTGENDPSTLAAPPEFLDLDKDGDFDMYYMQDAGQCVWRENKGTATVPNFVGSAPQDMQSLGTLLNTNSYRFGTLGFGDFNGDNILDVIVTNFIPGHYAWYKGVGLLPTLTTTDASAITAISATIGGNVTSDNGKAVTDRGFVYAVTATNSNPQISGTGVTQLMDGTGTGVFDEIISSLTSETQYSYAAYAINEDGTSYGTVKTFTTLDVTAPTFTSSVPTDGATAIATSSNIVLTFNEDIAFGTGNIQVIDVTDASNSFTIDAAAPGGEASISGAVLTIDPSSGLDDSSNYAIQIAATAIDDSSGNSYAGITDNTTLDFTTVDETNPTLTSSSPIDGATGITPSSNIVLTFNENIAFGTGNIQVIDVTNSSNSFTIDAATPGSQASISGAVLTINPSANLDELSNYAIQIAATAIDDTTGNSYGGIIDNTTLDFNTANNVPSISFTSTSSNGLESVSSTTISANLSTTFTSNVTVDYTVSGTATGSGTDYTLGNGTLTYTPGDVTEDINITGIVADAILEANETVIITLSNPNNGFLGTNKVYTYTITNNDSAAVTIADVIGNENDGSITVTATLDNGVQGGLTVDVSTVDGTATAADNDYTAVISQTLTFAGTAGESQAFVITIADDNEQEATEDFSIVQSSLSGTSLDNNIIITDEAVISITDDNDNDDDGIPNDQDDDSDGDGQSNEDEIACSSNPNDSNSIALDTDNDDSPDCSDDDDDNDGILDVDDTNPLVAFSSNGDEDGDGIPNSEEDANGDGNPFNDDCDNDGTSDFLDADACNITIDNISTAITPNSDGINDAWIIKGIENFPNSIVKVYNRSGNEVFGAQGYQNNWGGIYKGQSNKLPAGSYYFTINLGDGSTPIDGWLFINY